MKKVKLAFLSFFLIALFSLSFQIKVETRFGGTASVKVEVGNIGDIYCQTKKTVDGKKNGDSRVINVTTECKFKTKSDAEEDLFRLIKEKMKCYEEETSEVDYRLKSCEI